MVRYLTESDLGTLVGIAKAAAAAKGADFYSWKNPPELKAGRLVQSQGWGDQANDVEVSVEQALAIDKAKLDGAYGERFLLTVAYIIAAVKRGVRVALLQKLAEPGLPFDATGWVVVSVNGYPMFHVAPWDLPMADLNTAGLVTVIGENSPEAQEHGWKQTDKVQEFGLLLDWLLAANQS